MNCLPIVVAALIFVAACPSAGRADEAGRPNILLIVAEDMSPQLGCYGDRVAKTPHLDRLGGQGVRFNNAFVCTASCSESRAVLLTGRYPHQNGQIGLATHGYRLFDGVTNIVATLKNAGYRTGRIGKLHINPESTFPFDFAPDQAAYNSYSRRDVRKVAEVAAGFMGEESQRPFFLTVNYSDPHWPHLPQQNGLPEVPTRADEVQPFPWIGITTPGLRERIANYYSCVSRLDSGIGDLLRKVDELGLAEQTLVIFLSDHGAQFPRGKLSSYEGGLRVPLLMRWPGQVPAGVVRDALVSEIDLAPTMLTAACVRSPQTLSGQSLWPVIRDPAGRARQYVFGEYHAHYPPLFFPQRSIRDERYKLIVNLLPERSNPVGRWSKEGVSWAGLTEHELAAAPAAVRAAYATWAEGPPVELYDLEVDPNEFQNLAGRAEVRGVQQRLNAALATWQRETVDRLADPDVLQQLAVEHDAIPQPLPSGFINVWKYPSYAAPDRQTSALPDRATAP